MNILREVARKTAYIATTLLAAVGVIAIFSASWRLGWALVWAFVKLSLLACAVFALLMSVVGLIGLRIYSRKRIIK